MNLSYGSLFPRFTFFEPDLSFYDFVLWLLFGGPFALGRFIRVKRGLCPKCTYPMGQSDVCSECGKALTGRMAVTT